MQHALYILIMAGGEGTRFYPFSTPLRPKQFLSFWGGRTFIQQTFDRVAGLVKSDHIYVATNRRYVDLAAEQLPQVLRENIIGEPEKKNTAPCIAYAANLIEARDKESVIVVLPSDHLISEEAEFVRTLRRAIHIARTRDVLVTLGIRPTWAADCYGYIRLGKMIEDDPDGKWHAYIVDRFIEKPPTATAKKYMDEGDYVWNSGMFVWKSSFVLKEIARHLPKMKRALDEHAADIGEFFKEAESISIDYGVMERSDRAVTIPCNIGWNDIGTWKGLYYLSKNGTVTLDPEVKRIMAEQLKSY